ncbi:MAG: calpastatin [Rhizobiales bacterium 32-66-11]|nr:MAG: calpastatin [Rhizobiales bacterium 32-66-11]
MAQDRFSLARFVEAQDGVIDQALAELRAGRKRSHWMWFVFPQMRGLGHSPTAEFYGISSLAEARAYLAHPLLGPRLIACTQAVEAHRGRSLSSIFGTPDDLKFHSCMTLFAKAAGTGDAEAGDTGAGDSVFHAALQRHFGGQPDPATLALLGTD